MGKAQSKRSVDITTETKKGPDGADEVTGKLEKIEDIDQKQVNGDATSQEKNDAVGEKKDAPDETENEKDLTTEKTASETNETSPTNGSGDQATAATTETSPKEDASDATTPAKEGEEITPLADESLNKKSKKEKVKKKWSFRSISFGKKDKQKPAKTEGSENAATAAAATSTAENATSATNGDASETTKPTESSTADVDAVKPDDACTAAAAEAKPVEGEKVENGVATDKEQQQMNGQKTPTPTDDVEQKKPIETSTAAVSETATTATTAATSSPSPSSTPLLVTSSNDTANESHQEMKAAIEKIEAPISNGTADIEKNGDVHTNEKDEQQQQQHEEKKVAQSEETNKSIPVDEIPHQNGTNGDEGIEEITAATKTLQIEVKTEHQIDSVNSTSTTTNTTTIPAENLNSEQKTTKDNLFITSAQTDTNTTTNTSDMSLSSNNSIAIIKEQSVSHPNKVLDTNEETPKVVIEQAETNPTKTNDDADVRQPPPLPLSAPPSQVVIFALESNENSTNDDISSITTSITMMQNDKNDELKTSPEILETEPPAASLSEKVIEIIDDIVENKDIVIDTEPIIITPDEENTANEPSASEEIEIIAAEPGSSNPKTENIQINIEILETITSPLNAVSKTEEGEEKSESTTILDDFAAEALIIVDQIQKDLEKEDDNNQRQRPIDTTEIPDDLTNIKSDIQNEEATVVNTDLVNEQKAEEDMQSTIEITPNSNCSNSSETQELVDLESPISSLSITKNEVESSKTSTEEVEEKQIAIDIILENNQCLDVEIERNHQNDKKTIENHETIVDTAQQESEQEDCSLKSEEIKEEENINDGHKMMMNIIGINDEDDQLIDNSNKEIPNAKDLKENAAAAEITTQDLPVTCE